LHLRVTRSAGGRSFAFGECPLRSAHMLAGAYTTTRPGRALIPRRLFRAVAWEQDPFVPGSDARTCEHVGKARGAFAEGE